MILSDREIEKYIKQKKIIFKPSLVLSNQLGPASVDLKLGNEFRIFNSREKSFVDPLDKKTFKNLTKLIRIKDKQHLVLHPGDFILGVTSEEITLPDDIGARIEGRSSWGRLGIIIHTTAGYVDPGFRGRLTLEILNVGKLSIFLYPGIKICQLALEKLSSPAKNSYAKRKSSKYCNDNLPTESKIYKDKF